MSPFMVRRVGLDASTWCVNDSAGIAVALQHRFRVWHQTPASVTVLAYRKPNILCRVLAAYGKLGRVDLLLKPMCLEDDQCEPVRIQRSLLLHRSPNAFMASLGLVWMLLIRSAIFGR